MEHNGPLLSQVLLDKVSRLKVRLTPCTLCVRLLPQWLQMAPAPNRHGSWCMRSNAPTACAMWLKLQVSPMEFAGCSEARTPCSCAAATSAQSTAAAWSTAPCADADSCRVCPRKAATFRVRRRTRSNTKRRQARSAHSRDVLRHEPVRRSMRMHVLSKERGDSPIATYTPEGG